MGRASYMSDPFDHPEWADPEDHDPVTFAAEHGDWQGVALHVEPGDSYRKSLLGLDDVGLVVVRRHLARRGMQLLDEGNGSWLFVETELAGEPPDGNDDDDEPVLLTAATGAVVPESELDAKDTATYCQFCHYPVIGPPAPFCCGGRRRWWTLKIAADTNLPAFVGESMDDDEEDSES